MSGLLSNREAPKIRGQKDTVFECSVVFERNWNAWQFVVINQGGTSSGKTYSIMQCLFWHAMYEPGVVITVTTEDVPALKRGAYRDAETIYNGSPMLKHSVLFWHKGDRKILFHNGSLIEFVTTDTIIDAQQGKRDYLFINEANSVNYEMAWQMIIRTKKKVYLDYNPTAEFWVHDEFLLNKVPRTDLPFTVGMIISDHRHNPFLDESMHARIEATRDPEKWRVYARGLTGNVEGLIYTGWKPIDEAEFDMVCRGNEHKVFGGLDFGFTIDPTTGIKMIRTPMGLYVHELFYETGITMEAVKEHFFANGFKPNGTRVYCDHVPDNIAHLRRLRLLAMNANKGDGSVNAGIVALQNTDVYVTRTSLNVWAERRKYMWQKDKVSGKFINEPEDGFDHTMDAIRYGYYSQYFKAA